MQKPGVDLPAPLNLLPGLEDMLNKQLEDQLNPIIEEKRNNEIVPCQVGSPSVPGDLANPACECIHPTPGALNGIMELCSRIQNPTERTNCENCLQGNNADQKAGVWTGMGCIYANIGDFIQNTLLRWGVGIAGGISLLCIIYAAFMMQTSGGNPEKVKKAQQLMTSCITGLILVIFSVFILRLIGVTILRIPGFI
ncbi:MAG: pilin [Patescibacteria group bacterium]